MIDRMGAKLMGRPVRILWANPFCLIDTSSGASLAVREMLHQLASRGWKVEILGATIFDNSASAPKEILKQKEDRPAQELLELGDNGLVHRLFSTQGLTRSSMTAEEEDAWLHHYRATISSFKPDIVYYYGGRSLERKIPLVAQELGILSAAYVANGNYIRSSGWARNTSILITDSQATADLYKRELGLELCPVGTFLDPAKVQGQEKDRSNILFVNPAAEKGALIVAALALMLSERRPDIKFEIVEARGNWLQMAYIAAGRLGISHPDFSNVIVTPNTSDMRQVYGRARLVVAPSLWWESGPRVVGEAMLNGIPVIATNRGGAPEHTKSAGILFDFPEPVCRPPFHRLPPEQRLQEIVSLIERLYDDQSLYDDYCSRALHVGREVHSISKNTDRLEQCLLSVLKLGDQHEIHENSS